jgi:signal transduction histidine kinase
LNAIVGFTSLLTSSDLSDKEKHEFTNIIQQNSDLLLNLINDILDLSRLEVNFLPFNFATEDVIGICKSVLMTTKTARSSTLEYKFESPLKECPQLVDLKRLQQVLINLLTNADKFTKEGSITLYFDLNKEQQRLEFAVKDTGCGIPVEKRNAIFERFTKLNSYVQGTGLGLSICQLIVEKLGGRIWVDPNYNEGACFRLYVPIKKEEESSQVD